MLEIVIKAKVLPSSSRFGGAFALGTILGYPYLVTDPKNFLKAPIYTNFEGEPAPKKRDFLVEIFQKVPKNAFFFKNLPATQNIWSN